MTRPTPLAVLLLLFAAADSVVNGFVVRAPSSSRSTSSTSSSRHGTCHGLAPAPRAAGAALQRRSGSTLRMMGGGVEAVTPVLLAQLAGCAALVSTGKVLLKQEEEEGIEPAAPWYARAYNRRIGGVGWFVHSPLSLIILCLCIYYHTGRRAGSVRERWTSTGTRGSGTSATSTRCVRSINRSTPT